MDPDIIERVWNWCAFHMYTISVAVIAGAAYLILR